MRPVKALWNVFNDGPHATLLGRVGVALHVAVIGLAPLLGEAARNGTIWFWTALCGALGLYWAFVIHLWRRESARLDAETRDS
jgi:hypothetical protein